MNFNIKYILSAIIIMFVTISSQAFAQESSKPDSTNTSMTKMNCSKDKNNAQNKMDSSKDKNSSHDEMKCNSKNQTDTVSEINIDEIDKNKDGKVFIDEMCPEIIKDEPGNSPKCGMKLKEVTLNEAKEFLNKNTKPAHNHHND